MLYGEGWGCPCLFSNAPRFARTAVWAGARRVHGVETDVCPHFHSMECRPGLRGKSVPAVTVAEMSEGHSFQASLTRQACRAPSRRSWRTRSPSALGQARRLTFTRMRIVSKPMAPSKRSSYSDADLERFNWVEGVGKCRIRGRCNPIFVGVVDIVIAAIEYVQEFG